MKDTTLELSKRLVLTPFYESHAPTLNRTVADSMSREVYTVAPDDGVYDAAATMVAARVSGLPVVSEDDAIVGVVTLSDILFRCRTPHGTIADALKDWIGGQSDTPFAKMSGPRVRDVMNSPAITIAEWETIQAAAARMLDRKVERLPVVDKKGALVGIISRSDIIRELVLWAEQQEGVNQSGNGG